VDLHLPSKLHANIVVPRLQSESVLIQKLYTHFKKAPGTHKLGVLYVVDSVTRKWTEQAKSAGQTINSSAPDGTFAAGVHRVKELLPVLMNDIIQTAPDDQKVRSNMLELSSLQAYQHICISCGILLPPPKTSHTPRTMHSPWNPPYLPITLFTLFVLYKTPTYLIVLCCRRKLESYLTSGRRARLSHCRCCLRSKKN
jgi:hypothetical protein